LRSYVEEYSLIEKVKLILPSFQKKIKMMDLACGNGDFARSLKMNFNQQIDTMIGVDISDVQIDLAKKMEQEKYLGIEYIRTDVAELLNLPNSIKYHENFDLIVAVYLLNYAESKEILLDFCKSIYYCLKPNSKFITLNINVIKDVRHLFDNHKPYGLNGIWYSKNGESEARDGDKIECHRFCPVNVNSLYSEEQRAIFDIYYLSKYTYEQCFKEAGFTSWNWIPLKVNPKCLSEYEPGFWSLITNPDSGLLMIELIK
jgi:SAM-dependent methyltransferase